jgi:hypothetical protein
MTEPQDARDTHHNLRCWAQLHLEHVTLLLTVRTCTHSQKQAPIPHFYNTGLGEESESRHACV